MSNQITYRKQAIIMGHFVYQYIYFVHCCSIYALYMDIYNLYCLPRHQAVSEKIRGPLEGLQGPSTPIFRPLKIFQGSYRLLKESSRPIIAFFTIFRPPSLLSCGARLPSLPSRSSQPPSLPSRGAQPPSFPTCGARPPSLVNLT